MVNYITHIVWIKCIKMCMCFLFFECGFIETKHVDCTVFVWRNCILLMERNVALSTK